jgi:hypothetical protein
MGLSSVLASLFKGKIVAVVLVGTAVVGGGTVAMAATPAGQNIVHHMTIAKTATPTGHKGNGDQGAGKSDAESHGKGQAQGKGQKNDHDQQCAGMPEVQRLATKFSLSTDSKSDDVQALCLLHDGGFKGTTTGGASVSTSTVYGYGQIDQILTYAQFLANHDKGNADGKLTSNNVRTYLADALNNCGKTPLEACVKAKTSTDQAGNNGNAGNNNDNGNHGNNGNGKGKPTSTPTPKH